MSDFESVTRPVSSKDRLLEALPRWVNSWQLGLGLAVTALVFVAYRWQTVDLSGVLSLPLGFVLSAAFAYGAALVCLALVPVSERQSGDQIVSAGLAAHLLKYVPGSLWQGQRLFAAGGRTAVGQFALGVLLAAGLGLGLSSRGLWVVLGFVLVMVSTVQNLRFWGVRLAVRSLVFGSLATAGVAISGAMAGAALGLEPIQSGREITGAWGFGVLAIPVPAGIGMRELYLSFSASPDAAAQLGLVHRVLTMAADAVVGLVGFLSIRRNT